MLKPPVLKAVRLIALVALVLSASGCSEKGLNNHDSNTSVGMSLKITSPGLIDEVSAFRVIVTADDIDPPIESPLTMTGRYLEGSVEVPPGPARTFTVEAENVVGVVLYRGDTTVNIDPDSEVELMISLFPQVSLTRVSPRYLEVLPNSQFGVDVRVFNIPDLYGIAFRLHWQGTIVYPDSAASLLPLGVDPIFVDRIEPNLGYYAISVTQTAQGVPIVDATGHADIARVYFTGFTPDVAADTASLTVEVTGLTDALGGEIPIGDVSIDGSTVVVGTP
ncbi:MAG: hypothetical protein OEV49_02340 [candidate division Zixibacteria bacterium]|nr:hypothetical protein [candidate division Zixibacteria bacterium]MDH3937634.1 hypothetical protein [candidate division Zixibacteria bacterium]MDH4034152.1 hypothetical protein [candidate division Zixibacteria bacterium]